MPKSTQRTDRLGVAKVIEFFARAGWLFREQVLDDYGIDGHVEIVERERALGTLIGMQIKSEQSYFRETTDTSIIFRSNNRHIEYWIKHLLPVVVILYDDTNDALYWEVISKETIKRTGKDWRLDVPKEKILSTESLAELKALTQPFPYTRRLNRLRLDRAWIDLVAQGEVIYIEFEDWVNKSLPRFSVEIGCDTRNDIKSERWPTIYSPGICLAKISFFLTTLGIFRNG